MLSLKSIQAGKGSTQICSAHTTQMVTFARGGGVEFFPVVDPTGQRKRFLDAIVRDNRLDMRDDAMINALVNEGRFLLYLRPTGNPQFPYQIHDYSPDFYRAYYDASGMLESVKLMWAYKLQDGNRFRDRWVMLRLTAQTVEKTESWQQPKLDEVMAESQDFLAQRENEYSTSVNSLGFLSCTEVKNVSPITGVEGVSDFERLAEKIIELDDLQWAINENVYFFCTSPFETSREASEVTESAGQFDHADSPSYAQGFRDLAESRPQRNRSKLKRVIGGFDPANGDYIRQIPMNALPGGQLEYVDGMERTLRESLGGILERGVETATETNAVYGKAVANARKKQLAVFKYGLGFLLEMAIRIEEMRFVASRGREGLPEFGDRAVSYRVSPVFMESTNEVNLRSITARNEMKFFGISAKAALKYVHPNQSDAEIALMLGEGGFPSEYLQTAIGMYQSLSQLIDPFTGAPPIDPNTGQPLANLLLPFITENLIYGREQQPNPEFRDVIPDPNAALAAALAEFAVRQSRDRGGLVPGNAGDADQSVDLQKSIPKSGTAVRRPGFLDFSASPILNAASRVGSALGNATGLW